MVNKILKCATTSNFLSKHSACTFSISLNSIGGYKVVAHSKRQVSAGATQRINQVVQENDENKNNTMIIARAALYARIRHDVVELVLRRIDRA